MHNIHGGGNRPRWEDLPASVQARVEALVGGTVVEAKSASGGFSPGFASSLTLDGGSLAFVKAMSDDLTPGGPDLYRGEVEIVGRLPPDVPSARLLASDDDGDWIVLVFEHIEGANPVPSRPGDLAVILDTYSTLARTLTVAPAGLPSFEEAAARHFDSWRDAGDSRMIADGPEFDWAFARLDRVRSLAEPWREAVAGTALLHGDLRADNMVLSPTGKVTVVDWPEACVGAPWLDFVLALPSIAMYPGTPSGAAMLAAHPLTAGIDTEALDTVIAAMAGFFTVASMMPPVPGLPALRRFQRDQASEAMKMLRSRVGPNE